MKETQYSRKDIEDIGDLFERFNKGVRTRRIIFLIALVVIISSLLNNINI